MEAHEAPPPAAAAAPLQQAPNLPPPRLIISEMVLENFKSYAGEQRVGPFHKVCVLAFFLSNAHRLLRREKKRFHKLARANATSNARAFGGSIPQGDSKRTIHSRARFDGLGTGRGRERGARIQSTSTSPLTRHCLSLDSTINFSFSVFLLRRRAQRLRQVKRHRRAALRVWQEGQAGTRERSREREKKRN